MATIEDFEKLQFKIGTVISAEKVHNSDKLIKLEVDFGSEKRIILTGLAEYLSPDHFVGKQLPFVYNFEPKKLRGIESQGMLIATDDEDGRPVLLMPEKNIPNGSKLH